MIRKILLQKFPDIDFDESSNFIEDQLLDSLTIAEIIEVLETKFGMEIDAEFIIPDNFIDFSSIENLVIMSGGKI